MRRAVAFLTPFGGARTPDPGALAWFPAVGAGLGLALGGIWWVAGRWWPPLVAAAVVVAADLALTGLLHFDGLADTADGLLPPLDRTRRLEVMAAPDVGAFGLGVGAATLLLRVAALAALRPAPLLLAGLWCLSRTLMAAVATTLPYARAQGGLASAFLGRRPTAALAAGAVVAAGLVVAWRPAAGGAALVAGLVGAGAVVGLARRRIGGFTGDVLGATGVVAETFGLLAAAGRWS